MITNITELLAKYDKINFDSYERKEFTKSDWVLRYNLTMSEILGLQIIFNLYYRERIIHSWGCVDEDNLEAVKWIKKTQREIEERYWDLENNSQNIGKEIFAEL